LVGTGLALLASVPAAASLVLNDGVGGALQINAFQPLGQSFTAISSLVISIGFNFRRFDPDAPVAPITISLYAGTGTGGALVAQRRFTLANDKGFTDIAFDNTPVVIGQIYTAALTSASKHQGVLYTKNLYAGGQLTSPSPILALVDPRGNGANKDLAFSVKGVTPGPSKNPKPIVTLFAARGFATANFGIAAVPEPAHWALLVTGFGLVGAAMRRRTAATA
jgi:hypothetical protein